MGREQKSGRLRVLNMVNSVGTHDGNRVHAYGHTGGRCPKCECPQILRALCVPNGVPRVPGCEVEGEHLHLLCPACKYPWAERPRDHAVAAERLGVVEIEGEGHACLAVLIQKLSSDSTAIIAAKDLLGVMGHRLEFVKSDDSQSFTVTILEPEAKGGKIVHPDEGSMQPLGGGPQ